MRNALPSLFLLSASLLSACSDRGLTGHSGTGPGGKADDPAGKPSLDDEVVMQNEFCTYANEPPYVREVQWDHPKIAAAMRRLGPGWRSTFSYADWKVSYGLEKDDVGNDEQKRNARVRNFIRVLCGEFRDYPRQLERKLDVIGQNQVYAGPDEVVAFDLDKDLFSQITFPAYERMVDTMGAVHSFRQSQRRDERDGFNFNIGDFGGDSNRVEHSVPPWTHCEMKFMFSQYMVKDAPIVAFFDEDTDTQHTPETYEKRFAEFRATQCSEDDLAVMYNFRGHNNNHPLFFESNAFLWNSRRARRVKVSRDTDEYYKHPFAERYFRTRQLWAAYLFHSEKDNKHFGLASQSGGGPILYITDQDLDGDLVADYRLFPDDEGCGDQGVGIMNPDENCNMVSFEQAAGVPNSKGHFEGWDPEMWPTEDMGFLEVFPTFEQRMARLNGALDRHTNWGPTSYYMLDASPLNPKPTDVRMIGAYSPIVAMSYDISASDFFARRDFVPNDFEEGKAKWMFIMKLRTSDYYDEEAMKAGKAIDFDRNYFNETSLSNDFFSERALDHFGFVPPDDLHAVIYFAYGDRGEEPPELEDIPAP